VRYLLFLPELLGNHYCHCRIYCYHYHHYYVPRPLLLQLAISNWGHQLQHHPTVNCFYWGHQLQHHPTVNCFLLSLFSHTLVQLRPRLACSAGDQPNATRNCTTPRSCGSYIHKCAAIHICRSFLVTFLKDRDLSDYPRPKLSFSRPG
jgi:hypothetical protein